MYINIRQLFLFCWKLILIKFNKSLIWIVNAVDLNNRKTQMKRDLFIFLFSEIIPIWLLTIYLEICFNYTYVILMFN